MWCCLPDCDQNHLAGETSSGGRASGVELSSKYVQKNCSLGIENGLFSEIINMPSKIMFLLCKIMEGHQTLTLQKERNTL